MNEPSKAVFLSYASQDTEAARRICETLQSAGIEVWFDQSELRGGDVWDHKIRQQIHDCGLFVPIISAHTDARTEGYFRLEWKLAVDRSYLMADDAAFLFPVVIDDTSDVAARVPEKFRTVQWTRAPAGQTPAPFAQRVAALLAGTEKPISARRAAGPAAAPSSSRSRQKTAIIVIAALAALTAALFAGRFLNRAAQVATPRVIAPTAAVIPEHSIAVLPFVDLSAQKNQDYFSDGLAEELLNLLSKVPGLQVAAKSSAFSFKGHAVDVKTIGRQLLVAHVLEGSVRKVGNHLRVTAQLERADNGYQIWSETYDRELGDVFRIQDEISAAVVKALKVSLLGGSAPRSTGTQNSDAYLVFLQGRAKMASERLTDVQEAAQDFERVLKLDPNYAPAYVELATAKLKYAEFHVTETRLANFEAAKAEAKVLIEQALTLDPKNAQAYIERGRLRAYGDPKGAESDYRRGLALNPNSARGYDALVELLFDNPARLDEVLAALAHARQLDPLEPKYGMLQAKAIFYGRGDGRTARALLDQVLAAHPQYVPALIFRSEVVLVAYGRLAEAATDYERALRMDPLNDWGRRSLILDYVILGDVTAARQVADEAPHRLPINQLAIFISQGDWHQAAQVIYGALADGTIMVLDGGRAALAMRVDAHKSKQYGPAHATLEKLCGLSWSATGAPILPTQLDTGAFCVALAEVLISSGDRPKGEKLLRATLAAMNYAVRQRRGTNFWFANDQAIAYALLGDAHASVAAMSDAGLGEDHTMTWTINSDPAFDGVRSNAEFMALVKEHEQKVARERQELARLRAAGRLPDRSHPTPTSAQRPAGSP